MVNNYFKPFRLSLKLGEGKSPHLYVTQLKQMMKDDTSLHPMMSKTLLMLKKTRTPFIMLSSLRELVVDPINMRHYDRSAEPRGSWVCTLWSDAEVKQHKENPEEHIKSSLKLFQALGYDLYNTEAVSLEYLKSLEELTSQQIKDQLEQRSI